MPTPAYRTLGLTVPVTDALDARKWRELYAQGVILGRGSRAVETDSIDAILACGSSSTSKTAGGRALFAETDPDLCTAVDELSDSTIRWHLRVALSELEVKIGIPMGIVICKGTPIDAGLVLGATYDVEVPRKPFTRDNQLNWYRIDLPAGVISVERVRAYWFDQMVWSIADTDGIIKLEHPGISSIHLMPNSHGSVLTIPNVGYGAMPLIWGYPSPVPNVWSVDYTLGPKSRYGAVGTIEAVLAHWVYCRAAPILFGLAAQAVTGGVTSASLSIDGLSKSVSIPAGIHDALIQRFTAAEEGIDWKALKTYKKGLRVVPYGA